MKHNIILILGLVLCACAGEKKDEQSQQKQAVCDSVDTEMFDEHGNAYTVRMPRNCDTVKVQKGAH